MIQRCPIVDEENIDILADDDELAKSGPFYPHFQAANTAVFYKICDILGTKHHIWVHCKKQAPGHDGRGVYKTLVTFILGDQHVHTQSCPMARVWIH